MRMGEGPLMLAFLFVWLFLLLKKNIMRYFLVVHDLALVCSVPPIFRLQVFWKHSYLCDVVLVCTEHYITVTPKTKQNDVSIVPFEQELAIRGMQRRAELPQRLNEEALAAKGGTGNAGADFVDCQGFVRCGACRSFNKLGRCSNHHPLGAHVVEFPRPRCPQVGGILYLTTVIAASQTQIYGI